MSHPVLKMSAAAVLACAMSFLPATASARQDERVASDESGNVLSSGSTRVGLWRLDQGIGLSQRTRLEIGTYTLPWLAWTADVRLFNARSRLGFRADRWAVALDGGGFYLDLENQDMPARIIVVPVAAYATRHADAWDLSAGVQYNHVSVEGEYEEEDLGFLQGAVAARNVQLVSQVRWQSGSVLALTAGARLVALAEANAEGGGRYMLDARTTVEGHATARTDMQAELGYAVSANAHWSWDTFNIELGATYGNYTIPGLGFVVPVKITVPEIDLYWVF